MKCKICGKYFKLKAENRYEAIKAPTLAEVLTAKAITYECFDCPKCGCQNLVNIREANNEAISASD